jgi:hypothetical protein
MKRLPIVGSDDHVILDDDVADFLLRRRLRVYRPNHGNRRPFFNIPRKRSSRWPKSVTIARWLSDGYRTGMFARHVNGNLLDCRRENLLPVERRADAVFVVKPEPPWGSTDILIW